MFDITERFKETGESGEGNVRMRHQVHMCV